MHILQDVGFVGRAGTSHQASLRYRKKAATRQALKSAATRLIAEHGLNAVTVDDIAEAAQVSTRTFFNYFASKEDAVAGWDPDMVSELLEALRARPAEEDPFSALSAVLIETLGGIEAEPGDYIDRLAVMRAEPQLLARQVARWGEIERLLVEVLAERQAGRQPDAGRASPDLGDAHPALVVAATLAACRVAIMAWGERSGANLTDLVVANLAVLATGLSEPAQRKAN